MLKVQARIALRILQQQLHDPQRAAVHRAVERRQPDEMVAVFHPEGVAPRLPDRPQHVLDPLDGAVLVVRLVLDCSDQVEKP